MALARGQVQMARWFWVSSDPLWLATSHQEYTVYPSCSASEPLLMPHGLLKLQPKKMGELTPWGAIFNQWGRGACISQTILGSVSCVFQEVLVELSPCCPCPVAVSVMHIYTGFLTPCFLLLLPGTLLIE